MIKPLPLQEEILAANNHINIIACEHASGKTYGLLLKAIYATQGVTLLYNNYNNLRQSVDLMKVILNENDINFSHKYVQQEIDIKGSHNIYFKMCTEKVDTHLILIDDVHTFPEGWFEKTFKGVGTHKKITLSIPFTEVWVRDENFWYGVITVVGVNDSSLITVVEGYHFKDNPYLVDELIEKLDELEGD